MNSVAIIGMNYGDEGKGHITNYFSSPQALNIRFNGGAQAAHAVYHSDGRHHIFHHFGSGSLRGARTLLSNAFIVNPILFAEEFGTLSEKTNLKEIFIDPRCWVTTHYDMLINSFAHKVRSTNATAGVGINETVERSRFRQLRINMRNLLEFSNGQLKSMLEKIEHEYLPYRIEKLRYPWDEFQRYYKKTIKQPDKLINNYLETVRFILDKAVVWPDDNLIDRFLAKDKKRYLIFEGAQGLLLDQHRKEFMPFLTRSNTGLKNVFRILRTVKTEIDLSAYLVTRTYLTRHGDGPLMNPFDLPHQEIEEPTNPENKYQGKMRYGYLDEKWYYQAIKEIEEDQKYPHSTGVAFTCVDQVDPIRIKSVAGPFIKDGSIKDFDNIKCISSGVTEKDVIEV
jgi:adenylosuccinate synthase